MIATHANARLEAAIGYAHRGWGVIPLHWPLPAPDGKARCSCGKSECTSIAKHPLTTNGLKNAATNPAVIRQWWRESASANVGIVTGSASGIVVLDIDPKHDGPASLAALIAKHGELPNTVEAITGSGGSHRFFRHPGVSVPNSTAKLGLGLDVRGDGGYVVASPSLHASGDRYTWDLLADPDEIELADAPQWLLEMMLKRPAPPPTDPRVYSPGDTERHWLGKALARATDGNRNNVGFWLAGQLRDAGIPFGRAESVLTEYAERAPRGGSPYSVREALQSTRSAYGTPPRAPAESRNGLRVQPAPRTESPANAPTDAVITSPPEMGAADKLAEFMRGVIDGRIYNVPFPWHAMTDATQALQPGSFCLLGGDPGVGKTLWILQSIQFWREKYNPAMFFVEKNGEFYTRRLLAQLTRNSDYLNLGWVKAHPQQWDADFHTHRDAIDAIGKHLWTKPRGKLTLDMMLGWIRDRAKDGHRVIGIDPITAVDPGAERWSKDSDFVHAAQEIIGDYGVSLILTTHPKQASGRQGGTSSGHDAAGGAAYFRFVDTMIWLTRSKAPRKVQANHPIGGNMLVTTSNFARLLKTRDGYGAGWELAFGFGRDLKFTEHGVVVKDVKDKSEDLPDVVDPFPTSRPINAPRAPQSLDLEDVA
jgi:hypothetical protein